VVRARNCRACSTALTVQLSPKVVGILPRNMSKVSRVESRFLTLILSTAPYHLTPDSLRKSGLIIHTISLPGEVRDDELSTTDLRQYAICDAFVSGVFLDSIRRKSRVVYCWCYSMVVNHVH
jgi:hypothetical protein